MKTLIPLLFKSKAKEEAKIPFPNEETTPPVTKTNLVAIKYPTYLITFFSLPFFFSFLQGNEKAFTKKKDGLETILSAYFFGVIGCGPSA